MTVCEARNCKRREQCMKYENNYFKYNHTHDWKQLIDWSRHGSCGFGQTEDGVNLISRTYDCGDDSITYPMFEPIPTFNNKIYIVNGYINESGDEDTWIEELFADKEQANACCEYLNITNTQKNVTYYISEHDGFCKEDYISKLEEILSEVNYERN